MQPYNPVKRTSTDKVSSVNTLPELIQTGLVASKINVAYTFVPCDIPDPKSIVITPVKLGTTSANGVALFTTVVGYQVDDVETLSAISDLDAHAASIDYNVGTIVKATETGGTQKAYVCIKAHTSTAGPDFDADIGNWLELPTTTFLKVTHTAAGADKVANFNYTILGQ